MADEGLGLGAFGGGILSIPLIIAAVVIIAVLFGLGLLFIALFLWVLQGFIPILLVLVGFFLIYRSKTTVGMVLVFVGITLWVVLNIL